MMTFVASHVLYHFRFAWRRIPSEALQSVPTELPEG